MSPPVPPRGRSADLTGTPWGRPGDRLRPIAWVTSQPDRPRRAWSSCGTPPAPRAWRRSTALLTEVLDRSGLPYEAAGGEAAFYGPEIDVQVTDNAGRESTLSTVQVDFHQPERFALHYIGADGARHRPVMVHRSIIGSVERPSPSPEVSAPLDQGGTHSRTTRRRLPRLAGAHPTGRPPGLRRRAAPCRCGRPALRPARPACRGGRPGTRQPRRPRPPRPAGPLPGRRRLRRGGRGLVALRLRDGRRLAPQPVDAVLDRIDTLVAAHSTALWS